MPTNQIPITAPANYSPAQLCVASRTTSPPTSPPKARSTLDELINVQDIIPNGKTDINADGEFSTDYIGYNFTYPTNTYAGRQVIYQRTRITSPGCSIISAPATNVPLNVRTNMLSWGYAADEFTDNGGWPYPLYVREARRMVSDYVMQQQDALGQRAATDSIALASYTLDSHPVARLAYNGLTAEEGGIGVSVQHALSDQLPLHHSERRPMPESFLHLRAFRQPCRLCFRPPGTALHDDQPERGHGGGFCH